MSKAKAPTKIKEDKITVIPAGENVFKIESQSGGELHHYHVQLVDEQRLICSCLAGTKGSYCKHTAAVQSFFNARDRADSADLDNPPTTMQGKLALAEGGNAANAIRQEAKLRLNYEF